jgi:hypothetical protein
MAAIVQAYGLATIKVDCGAGLETLGYTRNGAEENYEAFWIDVPGDQHGGDQGPPIEVQYLGEIARIRLEMTKYDEAVLDKVKARLRSGTAGTVGTPGTLMFAGSKYIRVLIHSVSEPRNFPIAIVRSALAHNAARSIRRPLSKPRPTATRPAGCFTTK